MASGYIQGEAACDYSIFGYHVKEFVLKAWGFYAEGA